MSENYSEAIARGTQRRNELNNRAQQLEAELQKLLRCCPSAIKWFRNEVKVERAKDAISFDFNQLTGGIVFSFGLDDKQSVDIRVSFTLESAGVNSPLSTFYADQKSVGLDSLTPLFTKMQNDMNDMFLTTALDGLRSCTINLPTRTISYREPKRKIEFS